MKRSILDESHLETPLIQDVLVVEPDQRRCRLTGSSMLKGVLLLAILVPACSLLVRAISNGKEEVSPHNEVYSCKSRDRSYYTRDSCTGSTWTFLVLAMSWPQTFCLMEGPSGCEIPENVNNWTIHGLWPSCAGTVGPASCNTSAAFDPSLVKDLMNDLNVNWPNLLIESPYYDFWVHEWCKHGTCASNLPDIAGEHKYFSKSLNLHQFYNPYRALEAAGIVPSDNNTYSAQALMTAVQKKYSVKPFIGCSKYHGTHYLHEIYICTDKDFSPIDCHVPSRDSCVEDTILYPAIKHG